MMTGFEEDEEMILADMSILEFYLHRSTMLRLQNYPISPGEGAESQSQRAALRQAHQLSLILNNLMANFDDGQLPLDAVLKKRLSFGALVGYLGFHQGGSCPIGADGLSCCPFHRLEGLKLAHGLLGRLLESSEAMFLQKLADDLCAVIVSEGKDMKLLEEFEESAFAALKRSYQMMEPPIVAKLVKSHFLGATQQSAAATQPPTLESQVPRQFYTQAPGTVSEEAANLEASLEGISQFSALPAVLPASSQVLPPIRQIPFEVYGMIMKAADRSEDIFDESDGHIEKSMSGYVKRLKMRMDEVRNGLARITQNLQEAKGIICKPSNLFAFCCDSENWNRYQAFDKLSVDLSSELLVLQDLLGSHNGKNHDAIFAQYVEWFNEDVKVTQNVAIRTDVQEEKKASAPLPANISLHPVPTEAPPSNKAKKRLKFDGDDDQVNPQGEAKGVPVVANKKKSMLLPNETAKKLQWNDQQEEAENVPAPSPNSSPPELRIASPAPPNSSSQVLRTVIPASSSQDVPLRLPKPATKSAILPSSSQTSIVQSPKRETSKADFNKPASILPSSPKLPQVQEQPLIPCSAVAPPTTTTSLTIQKQKGRKPFSEQEMRNLAEGLRRFGRKWAIILATYEFNDRTQVDLKDKARNMERAGLLPPSSK